MRPAMIYNVNMNWIVEIYMVLLEFVIYIFGEQDLTRAPLNSCYISNDRIGSICFVEDIYDGVISCVILNLLP